MLLLLNTLFQTYHTTVSFERVTGQRLSAMFDSSSKFAGESRPGVPEGLLLVGEGRVNQRGT